MSELTEKTIGILLKEKFFIPSYQRGYRWTEIEVEDLLNDIWEFIYKSGKKDKEWYCLQPIVVKKDKEHFEVLDGQQRLTTIFLILKHLKCFIESERTSFEIEYETRNSETSNSLEFLQNIDLKSEQESTVNIDYFHIFKAYQKIKKWFQTKANEGHSSISSKFITPFLESTKVIWYEVSSEKDVIDIFTRINMGKIPLTNAELIKALFLNSSNFPNCDPDKLKLKQLEIASEWDRMEYSLQNKEFWYFINKEENTLSTRIEYIFNLMKDIEGVSNGNDQYSTFRFFSEKFKTKTQKEIEDNWQEIKILFQTIEEWFNDRELYHKTGYLIAVGEELKNLIINAKNRTKKEFKLYLNAKISDRVKCENLQTVEYGNNALIRNILLLHNIQTMLNNKNESSRFPFDRYKNEKWDIEHIHAIATEVKVKKEQQKEWLNKNFIKTKRHTNNEFNTIIENIITNEIFIDETKFDEIIIYVLGEDDNHIRNLCLLDRGTNRSYKNDSFKEKRKKIIENEKEGTFIPICTKNIFMKYYSKDLIDLELWNEADREAYYKNINVTVFTQQN